MEDPIPTMFGQGKNTTPNMAVGQEVEAVAVPAPVPALARAVAVPVAVRKIRSEAGAKRHMIRREKGACEVDRIRSAVSGCLVRRDVFYDPFRCT